MAVIGSKISPATASPAATGAAGTGAAAGATAAAAAGAAIAFVEAPASTKARMSFFVTRPLWPVPGTCAGSMPCSAAIRATTGETNALPLPASIACGAGLGGAASSSSAGEAAGSGRTGSGSIAGSATAEPAGAITASTVPTSTVSPSATRICATTPSPGLGTSVSTLSVEISSSGSSRAIASPSCLSHFVTVPSETETPIWGITTSTCVPVATRPPSTPRAPAAPRRRRRPGG